MFPKSSVHPQEHMYMKFLWHFLAIHMSSLAGGRMYSIDLRFRGKEFVPKHKEG